MRFMSRQKCFLGLRFVNIVRYLRESTAVYTLMIIKYELSMNVLAVLYLEYCCFKLESHHRVPTIGMGHKIEPSWKH